MRITIDTKEDSVDHIQHMIDFLKRFVSAHKEDAVTTSNVFENPQESTSQPAGMFGLFGSQDTPSTPPEPSPKKEEYSDDTKIEIIPY